MAYFIFLPNADGVNNTLSRIAEDQTYLNNMNVMQDTMKIIETSQTDFNYVKYETKMVNSYTGSTINYSDISVSFPNQIILKEYLTFFKGSIKAFLNSNPNNPLFSIWNNYYNQLHALNINSITYPLNKSIQQYFLDLSQPSLSPLQIP